VANSYDGLSDPSRYGSKFTNCFQSIGAGDLIDFCNPQLANVDPRTSLDNDIISLTFDARPVDSAGQCFADIPVHSGITMEEIV